MDFDGSLYSVDTNSRQVTFLTLVEHPGGHDGGEFPQYHSFGVDENDKPYYSTTYPESVTNNFDEEDPEDLQVVSTRKEALKLLKAELENAEKAVKALSGLVFLFSAAKDKDFSVCFDDGNYDEDEDEEN